MMFGLTFFGFIFALGGVIAASASVAVVGLLAMLLGLSFFGLQRWLSD
jgi:xanthosine utilization system XapX-like protein